jgi:Flp pilus assembly protein TadD
MIPSNSALSRITNRSFLSAPLQHAMVVGILFLFSKTHLSGREWIKISSPKAEVFSNAGAGPARKALEQLDWMTNTFQGVGGRRIRTPLRILIFANTSEFAEYRPTQLSVGFYQSGPNLDWICFHAGTEPRVALHEYTHLLLNRSTGRLPQWLEEGLAEFFSTLRIDNKQIVIGSTIPSHIANLRLLDLLPAKDLTRVSRLSIHDEGPLTSARFYATSWALVHMLYLSPQFSSKVSNFVEWMDAARIPPEQAFEKAFGVSLDVALGQTRSYIQQAALPTARVARPDDEPDVPISAPQVVDDVEIAMVQAELLLDAGRRDQAMKKFQTVAKSQSKASLTAQAFFALAQNEMAKARSLFEKLTEDPQADARVVFEYAMLLRETRSTSRQRVTELLERTLRQNPTHPEAHFLLGVRATDERRYGDAVEHLREAAALLPRQSSFWHALGYAQSKLGQRRDAENAAVKALRIAETEQEEKMARDLLQGLVTELSAPSTTRKPQSGDLPLPEGWKNRKGDSTATGTLVEFVCGSPAKVRISTGDRGILEFVILHPESLVLGNVSNTQMEFSCGPQDPKAIKIEYLSATRDITRIDFTP